MTKYFFSAYALTKEFDLNEIAKYYNINKKYKWEDYLVLGSDQLSSILSPTDTKIAHLYSFGCVVFINFSAAEMTSFIKVLETNFNASGQPFTLQYLDEYHLEIDSAKEVEITNDYAFLPEENFNCIDIISLILARSVALDRIENGIDKVLDEVEDVIQMLENGKLDITDKQLSKLASRILGIKHTSISYIMIMDKPDITWDDLDIDKFYYDLSELFEIEDRYHQLHDKIGFLMDVTEVFSSLAHESRSTRLEWYIIILITFELIVYLIELGTKFFQ